VTAYPTKEEVEMVGRTTAEYPGTQGHRWGSGRITGAAAEGRDARLQETNEEWEWKPETGVISNLHRKDREMRLVVQLKHAKERNEASNSPLHSLYIHLMWAYASVTSMILLLIPFSQKHQKKQRPV